MWLAAAIPAIALLIPVYFAEDFLKAYAVILQLLGAGLALWVIRDNLKLFEAGGLREAIREWWGRCPGRDANVAITGVVAVTEAGDICSATATTGPRPSDSVEVQLRSLWLGLEQLHGQFATYRHEVERLQSDLQLAIQEVRSVNESRNNELQAQIKKVAASSPLKAYFGAWMAAWGTVLSTYISEFTYVSRWLFCL
jgi:hypothetical protein